MASYNREEHILYALLINSGPLVILFFKWSFMKTWLSFVVWICHLSDCDSYQISKKRNWKQLKIVVYLKKKIKNHWF